MRLSEWIHDDLDEVQAILALVSDESAEAMVRAILAAQRVYVLGLGRSGLILRMFAMRLMQIGLNAYVVGDATTPAIEPGDLLIALSGSGRTETVVAMARKAKGYGAQVLAITSGPATPLAELADMTLIVPAKSVKTDVAAPTRLPLANALEQAMTLVLDCIGAMLAERRGQDNAAMMRRHANLE
ncbi:MAG: 6-phospho-3-hexuloisomerase [Caldilinea sp.]